MRDMIQAVKEHARNNYEKGGWDYVVECFDDSYIEELILEAGAKTISQAIAAVGKVVAERADLRADIQAEIF